MAGSHKQQLGSRYERLASDFLRRHGLVPVASNVNSRFGELDLVMLDGNVLVIAEVRYRGGGSLVAARATVDARKQRRIVRATEVFLKRRPRYANRPIRFDVVAIDDSGKSTPGSDRLEWIRDAFRPGFY